jgi:TonB family protein
MKYLINMLLILSICTTALIAGGKKDNTDQVQFASLTNKIVTDPTNGDKVYVDQLMIAFKESVTKKEKDLLTKNYNIKILSSAPSLNIYHVAFANPDASLKRLHKKRELLERNSKVLYAAPRRHVDFRNASANMLKDQSIERSGEITITQLNGDPDKYKPKTVNEAIKRHQDALSSCIKRKYRNSKNYHGKVSFRLTLNANGDVTGVHIVKTSTRDKQLTSCLLKKVKAWRNFPADPKKRNKRTINFTFEF